MEGSLSFVPQISHGIMDEVEEGGELGTPSSSSSSSDSAGSNDSSSSELADDATSKVDLTSHGAPYEMSSLMAELPASKRGLSRHFRGKSQSFTSLASVRCLEDLAKPERPYRKKLKPCGSYGAGLDSQRPPSPVNGCSKAIAKRPSRGAPPSLAVKRPGILGSGRPPLAPAHRSSSFSTQTLLFT